MEEHVIRITNLIKDLEMKLQLMESALMLITVRYSVFLVKMVLKTTTTNMLVGIAIPTSVS